MKKLALLFAVLCGIGFAEDIGVSVKSGAITLDMMHTYALKSVDVQFTAAQLAAGPGQAGQILIADPGDGYANVVDSVFCFVDYVATRNECGSCTVAITYGVPGGAAAATAIPNATFELNSDTYYLSPSAAVVPVASTVILVSTTSAVTSGDSILNCRAYYRTVKFDDI